MQRTSNQQTTNESSMSGTTTITTASSYAAFISATEYGSQIFTGLRSEYGMYKFADPHRQATYKHHEINYKKMMTVKNAYDKQELLRKMRADMKREYLTRKKQMKKLQMDAAVDFRNAENSLQEHYASVNAADRRPDIRSVDINAPLVSQIQLPYDEILDLKTFDEDSEFEKLRQIHADLFADQQESIRLCEQEEQQQREAEAEWNEQRQSTWAPAYDDEEENDDMTYTCDDHPDVLQLEVVQVTEPKERITVSAASSGGISAQKKAAAGAAAKAAKARQTKQELKKKAKFVPFKITMNTNRVCEEGEEEQLTTLLYQGRAQVNLPKKNLQNVSRKGKERHIAIWRRIETAEKHASARGTRIANIAQPKMWHDHPSDSE